MEASTRDEESPRACPCKWTVGISPRGGGADGEGVSPSPVSTASWDTRTPRPRAGAVMAIPGGKPCSGVPPECDHSARPHTPKFLK